ncbi:NACHT, LRR and PYD domains-containing protein 3, partial [Silurus asotus]
SRRNPTEDTPIKYSEIFKPLHEQDKATRKVLKQPLSKQDEEPIRNVLTKGVAGIGKTVSVQKFVLDWAEEKTNQDVHLIFPLPFRELNLMKEQKLSLVELLRVFFEEMKEMDISRLEKVLFIFDGLDECRFPLDFQNTGTCFPLLSSGSPPDQQQLIKSPLSVSIESQRSLGKLAFQQLKKQNLIFYEEDLRECDIDVTEAAVYSGVCTQIFREEFGLHQSKVYCFVHLSIQEHLAALYVHLTSMNEKRNVLKRNLIWRILLDVLKQNQVCRTLSDVHRHAVDQALKSQTGHLDLFLRFLLGLSLESNQKLLHSLVTQTGSSSQNKEKTVQYIKKKISEDLPTEKSINLFHCLNELGDDSLVEEIQQYLKSGAQSELSPSQWSALVFVLLTSAQDLEEFDLNKYITPDKIRDEILVRVMPVIAASRKAIIRCSEITGRSGEALTSVLNSETSSLRELHLTVNTLDLSRNKLEDSGVKRLSALLENPECKVKDLRLQYCGVSDEGCAALASALRSNPSHLRELNLSGNKVGDSGVKCLSAVLENPHCKMEVLGLLDCEVSDEGCAALDSALRLNPSHLRELYLSGNKVGDSGVKFLSDLKDDKRYKLQKL